MDKKVKIKKSKDNILNRKTTGEKIVFSIFFVLFVLYAVALLYPVFYLFVNSFEDGFIYNYNKTSGTHNPFAFPETWHFENYFEAFKMYAKDSNNNPVYLPMMYVNSFWICGLTVFCQIFTCCCTGYVFSKYHFKARNFMYGVIIFTMTIPIVGASGSMFKLVNDLGTYNTPMHVLTVHLGGLGFNFLVMYGFFSNVSWSYAEAVFIDGGNDFTAFFKIMLPQAKASIMTLCIVAFISEWNDYMSNLMYLPDYPTIASGLYLITRDAVRDNTVPTSFAALIVSILPMIALFIGFSDVIMKNFSVGGLKG